MKTSEHEITPYVAELWSTSDEMGAQREATSWIFFSATCYYTACARGGILPLSIISGANDSDDVSTNSSQWVDKQRRGLRWPEFDGLFLLSCSGMENSVEQHIYSQTDPHYTAAP